MFRNILLLLIAAFFSLYLVSCTDDPSSIGSALVNQDQVGLDSLDSYKDTLAQTSTNYKFVTPLGSSQMLLLGKSTINGVSNEAYSLLSFYIGLQDTLKTIILEKQLKIKSASVELDVAYKLGSGTSGFSFTGHKVTSGWTSTGFTSDSLGSLQYDGNNSIIEGPTFSSSDSVMTFKLDTALVSYWLSAEADEKIPYDFGILLKPTNNGGILGFHSINSSNTNYVPLLTVVVSKEGWSADDTLKYTPAIDVSVVKGDVPSGSTENIYLQSAVMLSSVLKFDLSKVPEHAIINYAQLELTADTNLAVLGDNYTDALYATFFGEKAYPDSSVLSNVALTRTGNIYSGNISSFVQKWLSTKVNDGVLLRTTDLYNKGLDMFVIKSSTAADPAVRPRLKIIYTNKK